MGRSDTRIDGTAFRGFAVALLVGVTGTGCVRQHLDPAFGESARAILSRQAVPTPPPDGLLRVLDGASAAQIHQNYRKSLAIPDTRDELGKVPDFEAGD